MKKEDTNKHHSDHKKNKKPWWLYVILAIVGIYIINGIVFAVIIYSKQPDTLQSGKKYPYEQKITLFMTKIYPFPAAWVNYKPIWVKNLYKQLGYIKTFSAESQQEMPKNSEITKQVLDQMIDTDLISEEAKKNNITVSKEEIDKTYDELAKQNEESGEKLEDLLKKLYGMNEKEFKKLIKEQLLRQKVQEELFVTVTARHILIQDEGKAKEVLEKIKNNEIGFEDAAKEHSEDTGSKDNGGDLGWFGRGMMVPEFENAIFALNKGEMTNEPVKTDFGYHIIKLEDKKGTIDSSFLDWFNGIKDSSKISKWIKTEPKDSDTSSNIIDPEAKNNESEENKEENTEENKENTEEKTE